jgi:hypothetical protein
LSLQPLTLLSWVYPESSKPRKAARTLVELEFAAETGW